ncbi:hypothetical protein FVE85_0465 [Porphyridium purpureum]|uniref:Uncharacterized protein n=1 Tax=Porphyridium purpureum TaxID=35688 RepID=A0A5J4YZI9_PORPP|nr:hypothetical protein FVE85_0465 [Porphyridium purpureum]|eukprot:POR1221..scf208_2
MDNVIGELEDAVAERIRVERLQFAIRERASERAVVAATVEAQRHSELREAAENEAKKVEALLLESGENAQQHEEDRRQLKQANAALSATQERLKRVETEAQQMREMVDKRHDENIKLSAQLKDVSNQLVELLHYKADANHALSQAALAAVRTAGEFAQAKPRLEDLERRLAFVESERSKLFEQFTESTAREKMLESKQAIERQVLEDELASVKRDLTDAQKQKNHAVQEASTLQVQLSDLKHAKSQAELIAKRELGQLEELCELYKATISESEATCARLEKELKEAMDKQPDFESIPFSARALSSRKRARMEGAAQSLQSPAEARDGRRDEDAEDGFLRRRRPELDELESLLERETAKRASAESMLRLVQVELETSASMLEKQSSKYDAALRNESRLAIQLQAMRRERENAVEIARQGEIRVDQAERRIAQLEHRCADLEAQIETRYRAEAARAPPMSGSVLRPSRGLASSPRTPTSVPALRFGSGVDPADESVSLQKKQEELVATLLAQRDAYKDLMKSS